MKGYTSTWLTCVSIVRPAGIPFPRDDERHRGGLLVHRGLAPQPPAAEVVAVVARVEHRRGIGQAGGVERGQHLADLLVEERAQPVVTGHSAPDEVLVLEVPVGACTSPRRTSHGRGCTPGCSNKRSQSACRAPRARGGSGVSRDPMSFQAAGARTFVPGCHGAAASRHRLDFRPRGRGRSSPDRWGSAGRAFPRGGAPRSRPRCCRRGAAPAPPGPRRSGRRPP